MIHQFVMDYLEFILFIIIAAQGLILYGQSAVYKWTIQMFTAFGDWLSDVESKVGKPS